MRVTIAGSEASETIDIQFDQPQKVGTVIEILLHVHPWLMQGLPLERDPESIERRISVYTTNHTSLALEDMVANETNLEIQFHK
ncbi:hypothetical protein [Aneurinibacillus terranovensis]|uniref:hypothetical protein n=1 Tax=Aneurinibacillus terranovensis TaxID=278991 RepID=UPI0004175CA9|nr:hypothetical protein [Aneurinibacillus terranovensis]